MTQVPTNQSANPNQFGAAMGDDPREQDEEWEREGLLDPAWEKQQRKVSQTIIDYMPRTSFPFYNNLNP